MSNLASEISGSFMYKVGDLEVYVIIDEPLITVVVYDPDFKFQGRGNAKCDGADDFSIDFGHALAFSRAMSRYHHRFARRLVRSLHA